jgi:hypothetical protein
MNATEIKKELYKLKTLAKFSHYYNGKLFYNIDLSNGTFQFPISTVEHKKVSNSFQTETFNTLVLSEDLGLTEFHSEIKGSELIRWITKAIEKEDFIKLK